MKIQKKLWLLASRFLISIEFCCSHSQPQSQSRLPLAPDFHTESSSNKNQKTDEESKAESSEKYFSMAQAYALSGQSDLAIENYKMTLVYDPNAALVYARLATEYVKKGMLTAAMESTKKALDIDPKFIDARLLLAGLYSTARDNPAAILEYSKVLAQDPTHEEAAVYKSQVFMEDEKPEQATEILQNFVKRAADSPLAWYYLGRVYQERALFKKAENAYEKALEQNHAFSQAALALGFLNETQGSNPKAIQIYRDLYDHTQDPTAAGRLATIYLKDQKYNEAIPYLDAVSASDPEDLNNRVKLGLVAMELKQYDKSIQVFKDVLLKNPDSDRVLFYLGSVYEDSNHFDLAIDYYKKVVAGSKFYEDAVLHASYLMSKTDHSGEARKFMDAQIEKSPRVPSFYVMKASMAEESGQLDDAVQVLERGIVEFSDHEKMRYYLGSLYEKKGLTDKAIEQMEEILKKNPEHADALNYLGYTWAAQGVRTADSEKYLRKAIKIQPDNPYIRDSWGYFLFKSGRYNESIVELEKAFKMKPTEPVILEHLGDAYVQANLREKGAAAYRLAIERTKDHLEQKKISEKLDALQTSIARDNPKENRAPASISH